jgi:hypothetical protein
VVFGKAQKWELDKHYNLVDILDLHDAMDLEIEASKPKDPPVTPRR